MYLCSIQLSQVKVTTASATKYEALLITICHFIKQPEPHYLVWGLITFAVSTFYNRVLMYLPVVAPDLFLVEIIPQRFCHRMAADASCVNAMRFGQVVSDACVFREIPVSQSDIWIQCFQLVVKCPSHDTHKRSITKCHPTFDAFRKFYRPFVITFVAGLTEGNQVIGRITSALPAFDMVHIKYLILRFPFAALAGMPIPEQYIFTYIPETELLPLLILCVLNIRVFDFLDIKRCNFYDDFRNG